MKTNPKLEQNIETKIVLLLSGGKDSAECARLLKAKNLEIIGLCISGIQKKEQIGAQVVAAKYNFLLEIVSISFFDEETWNPFKLVIRDIAMGAVAIAKCKKHKARFLATGVKIEDINNPKLRWLRYFLSLSKKLLSVIGIQLIFPLMSNSDEMNVGT